MHHAYSVQYPDCPVEGYLESREGEEGGGEGKGWAGRVAGGRGAEGRGLIVISNSGLDCCLHNPRENHGHSLVSPCCLAPEGSVIVPTCISLIPADIAAYVST